VNTDIGLTDKQARRVVRARDLAITTLTGFARYTNIPSVPDAELDVNDRQFEVIETPLALHHIVILNALQLLVDGLLMYDPQVLDSPVDFASIRGEAVTPRGDRPDGGVQCLSIHDLSPNSKNLKTQTDTRVNSGDLNPHKPSPDVLQELNVLPDSGVNTLPNLSNTSTEAVLAVRSCIHSVLEGEIPVLDAIAIIAAEAPNLVPCKRVMLMMPPGSAKSTYASVVFPTWVMGKIKAFETILTGWGDPICRRHGKRARQICASPQYMNLFGTKLDPNTRSAEDWALTNGSSYKSSGINSGVAGFRTHGLVWDDLTKNRKEADSEGIRTDIHNAYIDDARSRKTPSAWEVGIGTRWHEDEIMGRILPEGYNGESGFMRCRDGNVWYIICMAAECERNPVDDPLGRNKGEMIWPEWFDVDYWAEKRMNPRSWGSLYQQRPAPEEGIVFKKEKFKRYTELPQGNNYISYDAGVSDVGDPTAMHRWRVDDDGRIYLVDTYYAQVTIDVWIVQLVNWVRMWKPYEVVSEAGIIRRASEPFIMRAMRKAKVFFTQTWINRSSNKQAMAAGAVGMVNGGQVFLPHNSDGDRFLDACLKFPASKDDHEVDSFVNLCLRLEAIWDANPANHQMEEKPVVIDGSISIKSLMPPRFEKKAKSKWAHQRKH
jgi:predicted phage terminase large subunit-like protein